MSDDAIHDNSMNDNSMYDDLINDNLINDNLMHENVTRQEALREVPAGLFGRTLNAMQPDVDMNKIAGSHDILLSASTPCATMWPRRRNQKVRRRY